MDPFRQVSAGEPLNIPAAAWNTLVEVARQFDRRRGVVDPGKKLESDPLGPTVRVLVQNNTGGDLDERSIVTLSTPPVSVTAAPLDFQAAPIFFATAPAATTSVVAVLEGPLADGEIGRAIILGAAVVSLSVGSSGHGYCGPTASQTGYLTTATSGPIRILWKESGTGTKLGVVLLADDPPVATATVGGSVSTVAQSVGGRKTAVTGTGSGSTNRGGWWAEGTQSEGSPDSNVAAWAPFWARFNPTDSGIGQAYIGNSFYCMAAGELPAPADLSQAVPVVSAGNGSSRNYGNLAFLTLSGNTGGFNGGGGVNSVLAAARLPGVGAGGVSVGFAVLNGGAAGSGTLKVGVSGVTTGSEVPSEIAGGIVVSTRTLSVAVGSVSGLGSGVSTFLATPTSANLAAAVTDETGSGALVFANSPTLVTPNLGTPSAGTLTNCTGLPISTGVSGLGSGAATFLATPSSGNLRAMLSDETGTGAAVFADSPTLNGLTVVGAVAADSIGVGDLNASGQVAAPRLTFGIGEVDNITLSDGQTDVTGDLAVSGTISGAGAGITSINANEVTGGTITGTGGLVRASGPTLTNPVVGTQTAGNNTTLAASTAFVTSAISTAVSGLGTGTVTSVSVVTANGVSGSVATATTTPAITLTLGAITPTSVSGVTISGSSTPTLAVTGTTAVSGTNTGDQTITLTGDVTGSGTGSFAATLANSAVTLTKMESRTTKRLIGRNTAGSGAPEEVTASQLLDWIGTPADGDILYRTAGAWNRLGIGTAGQVLTVASALPSWAPPTGTVFRRTQDFRLSLTTGNPFTQGDVAGASTLYAVPFCGNQIALYESSAWALYSSAEMSRSLSGLTSGKNYDVFAYTSGGTLRIDLGPAWLDNISRGSGAGTTELTTQDGVLVNSVSVTGAVSGHTIAAKAGRYLGTIRTTGTSTTQDAASKRFVWNHYHRRESALYCTDTTANWTYASTTWRQARANAANQVECVIGWFGSRVDLMAFAVASVGSTTNQTASVAVGEDSTTVPSTECYGMNMQLTGTTRADAWEARYVKEHTTLGYHYFAWLESGNTNTVTFFGESGNLRRTGLIGTVQG